MDATDFDLMKYWMSQGGTCTDLAKRFCVDIERASRDIEIASQTKNDKEWMDSIEYKYYETRLKKGTKMIFPI